MIIHIIVSYDQNISLSFFCERWIPCQALTSVLCLNYCPERVHCSTKDVYTYEITFLPLHPWDIKRLWPIHTVQISNMQYAFRVLKCMGKGRFCFFNFKQFSQNSLTTKKYCSIKDCKCRSSCKNGIRCT